MIAAKMQTATAIFAVRIDHAADKSQAAIDSFIAVRVIAQSRDTVTDVPTIFAFTNCPTHYGMSGDFLTGQVSANFKCLVTAATILRSPSSYSTSLR